MVKRRRRTKSRKPKNNAINYAIYALFLFLIAVLVASTVLYYRNEISTSSFIVTASVAQSFIFSFFALTYLLLRGRTLKQAVADLGFTKKLAIKRIVIIAVALFFLVLFAEIALGWFEAVTGVQLPTNVQQVFSGLPLYFIILSTVVLPVNEEMLFRGFLVPRFGIIFSALIFGAFHYLSYASISEFAVAFIFGIAAGYVRKKYNSLYPSIIAHILVNLLGFLLLFW
ncbi:MAG: CPBP family intramembrane metalloprotease [Candidatus Marsarchaeota archaeon]|nr:CPBP family intramembrane metalloprotease [Candidatus Marsarchaeota archaeon]MCL5115264.1 CPBP family intramembrane metalloprotease [Candidatus Marsarchaeota archaeon]